MPLRVYNTLTREKSAFQPVRPGQVGMYVCGPTVYKPSHIGHMVGPVIFDTVKRYLTYLGYDVTFVVNITDVDDKLIVRAKELGTTVKELAERMTADYVDSLKKLNVTGIDRMPRATDHIGEMIEIMRDLIDKGYAYPSAGDVYFDVSKDRDYGKLCHRDPEQMEAGSRVEVSDRKRNPGDFALWKGAKPGEPQWDSPWGPGRPGWHIECSAMSMKLLGTTLDIHGGGLDLQFPHHENELAQSESYTDQTFANYWMHNGLLKMGTAKMAGSVGNVVNVVDLLKQHHPETVRFLLLSTHYRSPIEYSEERLLEVRKSVESFYRFFERYERITKRNYYDLILPWSGAETFDATIAVGSDWEEILGLRDEFLACMDDDFNTGGAIGILYELLTTLNRFADKKQLEGAGAGAQPSVALFQKSTLVLRELSQILGLFYEPRKRIIPPRSIIAVGDAPSPEQLAGTAYSSSVKPPAQPSSEDPREVFARNLQQLFNELTVDPPESPSGIDVDEWINILMQRLIDLRAEGRKAKNFALADQIRQRLAQLGVTLEDRPGGTGWRIG